MNAIQSPSAEVASPTAKHPVRSAPSLAELSRDLARAAASTSRVHINATAFLKTERGGMRAFGPDALPTPAWSASCCSRAFSIAHSPTGRSNSSLNFQMVEGAIGQFSLRASGLPLCRSRCHADMSPNHSAIVTGRGGSLQPSLTHWLS